MDRTGIYQKCHYIVTLCDLGKTTTNAFVNSLKKICFNFGLSVKITTIICFVSGLPVVVTSPPQLSKSVFTSPTQKTETTPSSSRSTGVRSTARVSSSRKASSTPSLPEATTDGAKPLMESFEQTVSADNLSAKKVFKQNTLILNKKLLIITERT